MAPQWGRLMKTHSFICVPEVLASRKRVFLLMYAFAYEVIEKIRMEPLKNQIKSLVERRFRGELSKCEACVMCDMTPASTQWL
jgi:hypothetical protein